MLNEHEISKPEAPKEEPSDEVMVAFRHYAEFCMPFVMMYWCFVCLPDMVNHLADLEKPTDTNMIQT